MILKRIFLRRFFSCINKSTYGLHTYSTDRESRYLDRMIRKGLKRSKRQPVRSHISFSQYANNTLYSQGPRRNSVLNKVFMEQVSNILSTSEFGIKMYKLGIDVVESKISENHHLLYVYWIHDKEINEVEVNDLLAQAANHLRFELSSLRIMSTVPEVRFAKHKDLLEMEEVSKVINYLAYENKLREEEESQEDSELKSLGIEEQSGNSEKFEQQIPPMIDDIFGLKHSQILNRILTEKRKKEGLPEASEIISQASKCDGKELTRFDKKELRKVIFRKRYELKKQQHYAKQLYKTLTFDEGSEENIYDYDIDEEFYEEDNLGNNEEENLVERCEHNAPQESVSTNEFHDGYKTRVNPQDPKSD